MPSDSRASTIVLLSLHALLIGALAWLVFGQPFDQNAVIGFTTLIAIPFALGGIASTLYDPAGAKTPMGCFVYPSAILILASLLAWLFLGEGTICIVMLLPLWIPAAVAGTLVNRLLRWHRIRRDGDDRPWRVFTAAWTILPVFVLATDLLAPPQWTEHEVVREVTVAASAETIWPLLLSIPDVTPAEGRWTFTQDVLGVPRPSEARLTRENSTLVRKARWGKDVRFEEIVTGIDRNRRIDWRFSFPDDSVQRYTDRHVSPQGPMLHIASGGYELIPAGPGKTTIRLTTHYASRSPLDGYFALWGDRMLGDIQDNVLTIIADRVAGAR